MSLNIGRLQLDIHSLYSCCILGSNLLRYYTCKFTGIRYSRTCENGLSDKDTVKLQQHRVAFVTSLLASEFNFLPARASEQGNVIGSVSVYIYIGECGSTLYVGLSRMVRNLIQKSTV